MTKKQIFNTAFLLMAILGFGVLLFPWYSAQSSGYGYTYNAGFVNGFTAAAQSFLGYGLYALPAALIALIFTNKIEDKYKSLIGAAIGVGEILCRIAVNKAMDSYGVEIGEVSAGWETEIGYKLSLVFYIITIVVSLFTYLLATDKIPTNKAE